ncbi:MAG: response regulator [Bdellovibrionales bacterium]|nr:response regulator [Bdellovibrionales bacterium]
MRDILIVEDGLHERERLEKLFRSNNYTVSCAESVNEAERLLRFEQFRLAILDINLGDKSGSHLFEQIKRSKRIPYVIMLTGNPSIHLKQRFLDEGASAYVVKASPEASNESLLERVRSLLGSAQLDSITGIALDDFLKLYVNEDSRELFLDVNGQAPVCSNCGSADFIVTFAHKTQLPPLVEGNVICVACGAAMDPEVG